MSSDKTEKSIGAYSRELFGRVAALPVRLYVLGLTVDPPELFTVNGIADGTGVPKTYAQHEVNAMLKHEAIERVSTTALRGYDAQDRTRHYQRLTSNYWAIWEAADTDYKARFVPPSTPEPGQ